MIRLATSFDAPTIAAQRDAMFLDMGEDAAKLARVHSLSLAWHRRALESGLYTGFLADAGGEVVGGAGLLWQDLPPNPDTDRDVRAYVMNVYVRPDVRGQGLARRLLERVLEECAARDVNVVSLHASEAGRPLYEKLGFKATNEMRLKVGEQEKQHREQLKILDLFSTIDPDDMDTDEEMREQRKRS